MACSENKPKPSYPETKKDEVVDVYFGDSIEDPYRWLENDTSVATQDWVNRQIAFTDTYLNKLLEA